MNTNRDQPFHCPVLRSLGLALSMAAGLPLLLAPSLAEPTQASNSPNRLDFSAFKLVTERNIFDPRRSPRSAPRSTRNESPRRVVRSEYFTLVGIMDYEAQGPIAFFDGTSSQYQKVLKPADTIAGYKIAAIEPSAVKFAVGSNEFRLPLGMQLRRDSEGMWQIAEPAESSSDRSDRFSFAQNPPPPSRPSTGPPSAPVDERPPDGRIDAEALLALIEAQAEAGGTNAPPASEPGSGDTDSVLLRMMQRRALEETQ